jgi:putative ABC transport system permease protein
MSMAVNETQSMRDLRFAARALRKNPGFTAVAVLTIALGVGANSAIFSVVDAVMLRPLPWRDAERVVMIDPDQPIASVRTLDDVLSASVSQPRFRTVLIGAFCAMALVLAAIGVYGLLSHAVAQRTNEFGVRMALGASPSTVLALVLRQGAVLALTGVVLGLFAAAALARVLRSVLFEVSPWDPMAWVLSAGTLLAVALFASWVPAKRAVAVDPVVTLRT